MVKKDCRSRGRPRGFDEDVALDRATKLFWLKGFDGATLDDLVAATGVGRPSLYSTFGDKATLFMRCLEFYALRSGNMAVEILERPNQIRESILDFIRFSVVSATDEGPWGCLMVCVAPIVDDLRVREFLVQASATATAAIERRLQKGIEAGDLPERFLVGVRARQTLDLTRGLIVRARLGEYREDLLLDAGEAVALLLSS